MTILGRMKCWTAIAASIMPAPLLGSAIAQTQQPSQSTSSTDPGWPRTFTKDGTTVLMYQPQVDSWKDYKKIKFRSALEITSSGQKPSFGVLAVEADTDIDHENSSVIMTNLKVEERFPGAPEQEAAALSAIVKDLLPNRPSLTISLDRVLAYMHDAPVPKGVELNLNPPPIYYSQTPAILVVFMGKPEFKPVEGSTLQFAVNTNWPVLLDKQSSKYYLLNNDSWLMAADPIKGPWTAAGSLPSEFERLPTDGSWEEVRKSVPGQPATVVPKVMVTTEPAELIVTDGPAAFAPIEGTSLTCVNNPAMPVFRDQTDSNIYYLVAGRWFRAKELTGPWTAASTSLPSDFARIPPNSPMAYVLAAVPGTQQAKDAILIASIPEKATVNISQAKLDVAYSGEPQFAPIEGTSMKYAVNTADEVILADNKYYCCNKAVWFMAPAATGPWTVSTSVPEIIYTIPPTSPVYNTTYVRAYDSTPTSVVYGYTGGYNGEYVAATGALMFGAGMVTGALLANNDEAYWGCHPGFYSYGCAPVYHYGYGGYVRGAAYYGPYGGAGHYGAYNPATGIYSRGGYAAGPYGAAGYRQAYNPWTNTYGAHAGGTSGYGSWGASTVSRGDRTVSAEHATGPAGVTRGAAESSSGQWAEGVHSAHGTAAVTSSGDLYAGHDGNVYKNTGSGWQSYNNGNWNKVSEPTGSREEMQSNLNREAASRSYGNEAYANRSAAREEFRGGGARGGRR